MKITTNPIMTLTQEETEVLFKAKQLIGDICSEIDDHCELCPLYAKCSKGCIFDDTYQNLITILNTVIKE